MFTDKATSFDNTDNKPFYIKDGVNYKYPLYNHSGSGLTSIVINGTTYHRPTAGITTKLRPPKGLPENVVSPTGTLKIGNNTDMTNIEYDVIGVSPTFDFGSITDGNDVTHARFLLTDGEASGSFTESGASSGDSYKLYIEKTDTSVSDTIDVDTSGFSGTIAFHYGTFTSTDYSSAYSTVEAAATAGHVYSDTSTTPTYTWGTLNSVDTSTSGQTGYSWTPAANIRNAYVLMVAGGGGGGGVNGGGGGAGGLIFKENQTISGQKTIVVGNGGLGGLGHSNGTDEKGNNGTNTSFTGFDTAIGGGAGGAFSSGLGNSGGSGGGGNNNSGQVGTSGQGFAGGSSGTSSAYPAGGGGGAGGAGQDGVSDGTGGHGGLGANYTSTFGTTYGDSGYFASGGGGGSNGNGYGVAYSGGGTNGSSTSSVVPDAQKHTGGGGGGSGYNGTTNSRLGGDGGSGIVIIKSDGVSGKDIAKLTGISNVTTGGSKTINYTFNKQGTGIDKVTYKIGSGSEVTTASGVYTLAYTPADFGTTTITHAYTVDSSGNQLGIKFGPYSVTTKAASLGHLSTPILLFMDMGTTVTDSINSIAITQHTGTHTKNTSTNSIKNTGPGTMVIDFTSLRTSASSDVTITWEVYLESGVTWNEGFSIGNITASNASADSVGYLGGTNPTLHFEGNGQTNQTVSGSNISYSSYEGTWVQHTWNYTAGSNTIKTYINGALACSASPNSGTFEPESYFWLFCHARDNEVTSRPGDTNLICRNIEIYQASFTDAQILAAYES
tara:strand:- start:57 stop:2384 length:2328 start_codon:yes stop_codon:yes gene_type:complete